MTIEAMAIATSILSTSMCVVAFVLNRRSRKPRDGSERTITITIEDSTGARARTVTRSNRRVDDVRRDVERLVAQPS